MLFLENMTDVKNLRRIAFWFGNNAKAPLDCSYEDQKQYINHFREPSSNIERSYYQYRCQMKLLGAVSMWLLNLLSLPMIFIYLLRKNEHVSKEYHDALFISNKVLSQKIIPNSLKDEYYDLYDVGETIGIIRREDREFLRDIFFKYPFSWHFLFKIIVKMRQYSYYIERYSPQAIITCSEYSFASSAMTQYCSTHHVEHINVMHGEKLFYMRDSFFQFDRCYIWNESYRNLFLEMRAYDGQFIVAIPDSIRFSSDKKINKMFDYTYYLQAEDDSELESISRILYQLKAKGNRVAVRPHPIYSDMRKVKKYFGEIEIEDSNLIDIEDSVLRTKNVVSLYSTVLHQAIANNVSVVIDDVSSTEKFKKLKELKYSILQYNPRLLSFQCGKFSSTEKKI